ncbi:hypothetical protein LDENG_00258440 [Lucifuga dentata]|nr:hypothetical protein LDENG_00258440 [Lucifuga dentata]
MLLQRQYCCGMNQHHQHLHENKNNDTWRTTKTVIKLLPSIMYRIPAHQARHDQSYSSFSSPSSSCLPPPLCGVSFSTAMINGSPHVWDICRHTASA